MASGYSWRERTITNEILNEAISLCAVDPHGLVGNTVKRLKVSSRGKSLYFNLVRVFGEFNERVKSANNISVVFGKDAKILFSEQSGHLFSGVKMREKPRFKFDFRIVRTRLMNLLGADKAVGFMRSLINYAITFVECFSCAIDLSFLFLPFLLHTHSNLVASFRLNFVADG